VGKGFDAVADGLLEVPRFEQDFPSPNGEVVPAALGSVCPRRGLVLQVAMRSLRLLPHMNI